MRSSARLIWLERLTGAMTGVAVAAVLVTSGVEADSAAWPLAEPAAPVAAAAESAAGHVRRSDAETARHVDAILTDFDEDFRILAKS